jgi:hypothetical protein
VLAEDARAFLRKDAFLELLSLLRARGAAAVLLDEERARAAADDARPWLEEEVVRTARLVTQPRAELLALAGGLLERQQQIERADENDGTLFALRIAEMGLQTYRSLLVAPNDLGVPMEIAVLPSTAPNVRRGVDGWDALDLATRLLPSYLVIDTLHGGSEVGWRPLGVVFGGDDVNAALLATAALALRPGQLAYHDTGYASVGGVAQVRFPSLLPFLSRAEAGVRVNFEAFHPEVRPGIGRRTVGWELAGYTMFDKLRVGAAWLDVADTRGWENLTITLGVHDLPGFAYWATRWTIESL